MRGVRRDTRLPRSSGPFKVPPSLWLTDEACTMPSTLLAMISYSSRSARLGENRGSPRGLLAMHSNVTQFFTVTLRLYIQSKSQKSAVVCSTAVGAYIRLLFLFAVRRTFRITLSGNPQGSDLYAAVVSQPAHQSMTPCLATRHRSRHVGQSALSLPVGSPDMQ